MILFVNGCIRENSRTMELAKTLLEQAKEEILQIDLQAADPQPLNALRLQQREQLLQQGAVEDPSFAWARDFARADTIVVAAPYWDLMFPAMVRTFFELVCVNGITFRYNEKGIPESLCKAKKLIYVTTSGGPIFANLGYEYVQKLCGAFYGIPQTHFISAQGLDIWGADPHGILAQTKASIRSRQLL